MRCLGWGGAAGVEGGGVGVVRVFVLDGGVSFAFFFPSFPCIFPLLALGSLYWTGFSFFFFFFFFSVRVSSDLRLHH